MQSPRLSLLATALGTAACLAFIQPLRAELSGSGPRAGKYHILSYSDVSHPIHIGFLELSPGSYRYLDNSSKLLGSGHYSFDAKASAAQKEALVAFAKEHAGRAGREVVRVDAAPITMSLDSVELNGELKAGEIARIKTRKAKPGDCICSNEVQFYPPLAKINRFAAGVAIEAEFKGHGLGATWSTPESRSVYMGEFNYRSAGEELAGSE